MYFVSRLRSQTRAVCYSKHFHDNPPIFTIMNNFTSHTTAYRICGDQRFRLGTSNIKNSDDKMSNSMNRPIFQMSIVDDVMTVFEYCFGLVLFAAIYEFSNVTKNRYQRIS